MHRLVSLFTKQKTSILLRITLTFLALFTSVALGFVLLSSTNHTAHAAVGTLQEIGAPGADPWGITFDHSGNEWVAQPGCDPNPVCAGKSLFVQCCT